MTAPILPLPQTSSARGASLSTVLSLWRQRHCTVPQGSPALSYASNISDDICTMIYSGSDKRGFSNPAKAQVYQNVSCTYFVLPFLHKTNQTCWSHYVPLLMVALAKTLCFFLLQLEKGKGRGGGGLTFSTQLQESFLSHAVKIRVYFCSFCQKFQWEYMYVCMYVYIYMYNFQ
jgi:hypothetical protein